MNSSAPIKPQVYRYSIWRVLGGNLIAIPFASGAIFLFGRAVWELFLPAPEPVLVIAGVFTACACIIVCVSTTLFTATIFLDQSGITAQVAGITTKTISWEEIKRLEKFFTRDNLLRWVAVYKPMGKYQGKLGGFFPNTLGHIAFTTRIKNHEDLVEQLNHYARKYGIPQFVTAENNFEIRVEKF